MPLPALLVLLSAATSTPDCADVAGWNAGRAGRAAPAECATEGYQEAHRLGQALHELKREHADIDARAQTTPAAELGALRRRQRQIDIDLEAIRGVATTRGWPLDIAPEITP
jgi:hypothetical protein